MKTLLTENNQMIKENQSVLKNNILRITNLLDSEVEIPNLIVVVPKPEQSGREPKGTSQKAKKREIGIWRIAHKTNPKKWFQTSKLELHILCPRTMKTAVTFDLPEPTEFVKNNAGLIKTGLTAL